MGRKLSGKRPEDQPIFTNPLDLDFEKRRLFFTAMYQGAPPPSIKTGRSITYMVAASDAPGHVRAQADYLCDGTDDHVQIQAAIDALPATGGKVLLSQGTFNIESSILLDSYQTLWGFGRSTILTTTTADLDIITATGGSGTEKIGITISDLCVDGNAGSATNDHGIMWTYVDDSEIRNVWSIDNGEEGIWLSNCDYNRFYGNVLTGNVYGFFVRDTSVRNIISHNDVRDNTSDGINIQESKHNTISANLVSDNADVGIDVTSSSHGCIIAGNLVLSNDDQGIFLSGSDSCIVSGNECKGNGQDGIYIYGSDHCNITGNLLTENSQTTTNSNDDIILYGSDYCSVQGNTCCAGGETNKPRYGINISSATCDENKVINNDLYDDGFGTGPFNDSGTSTIYVEPGIDDTPVNGQLSQPISSNWAYDHVATGGHSHMIWDAGVVSEELTYDTRIAFDLGTSTQRY